LDAGHAASIKSARPTQAESGKPPVSALPRQIKSGTTPAVFAREPFSGAAKAGVNFVENQQRAEFVAQFSQQRQKFRGGTLMPPRACTGSTRIAPMRSRRKKLRI
jgi:hypothetical protein